MDAADNRNTGKCGELRTDLYDGEEYGIFWLGIPFSSIACKHSGDCTYIGSIAGNLLSCIVQKEYYWETQAGRGISR